MHFYSGLLMYFCSGVDTSTLTYTYDALDSVLSESDSLTNDSSNYGYDFNGRRISLHATMNSVSQPTISYGYDCADELIGMSNSTTVSSCSPSNKIVNGGTSTQVGINYDADGNPNYTVVDGVQNVMATVAAPRDYDERVKVQTFQAYPSLFSYGGLTYTYDADGHVIDKGGTLEAINFPSAVPTASYSTTDQVTSWNNVASTTDNASNLTKDPASGSTFTWTARNQMATATSTSEVYDGLGRRETSVTGAYTLSFAHDGSAVIGWNSPTAGSYNFLSLPGGGAVAGSYSLNGTTTTWVPLLDTSGSTIGLVNAAATGSPPSTTYTYSPSGNPTASGTANDWPFQYQGMEKEITDGWGLYYSGGGQFYSPVMVRSLSETSQTSSSGTGGPSGNSIAAPSGGGGPNVGRNAAIGTAAGAPFGGLAVLSLLWVADGATGGSATPLAIVGSIIDGLVQLFLDIFGGSDSPPIPRQVLHGRHPLYDAILGIQLGLLPDESSAGTPPRMTIGPCPPVPGPEGLLRRNIDLARRNPSAFYLAPRLENGGDWDYKPKGMEDFGNFNYGATMAAAGYSDQLTLRWAGVYHLYKHGRISLSPIGCFPYGNKPHSEAEIAEGIDYVEMGCDHD